jgi:hypothetical protein
MKFPLASRRFIGSLEPLEARIAPAVINAGDPGTSLDVEYTDTNDDQDLFFVSTTDPDNPAQANPNDPIAQVVGPGVFYIKMKTNDVLNVFGPSGYTPLISGDIVGGVGKGITGNLVAFFADDGDGEVEVNELVGVSLGNKVSVIISGTVRGDVVANYNDLTGALGGAGEPSGQAQELLLNTVQRLNVSGNVEGDILAGGQLNNLKVGGAVDRVLVGTAANGIVYDFNGAALAEGGDTLSFSVAPKAKGTSIVGAQIGNVTLMRAGDGGTSAQGGSLTSITLLSATDGFTLQAGRGGDGVAGSVNGGAGGLISGVFVNGLDVGDRDESLNNDIVIRAGDGGTAATGGKGGVGGSAQNVYVGFESKDVRSVTPLADAIRVEAGAGGAGKNGGAGGFLKSVSVFSSAAGSGNDLELVAGNGGAANEAVVSSKAGAGGSITSVSVLSSNFSDPTARAAKTLLRAGDGGTTVLAGGGAGAIGGSITTATVVSFQSEVRAGNGSTGTVGGAGGNLTGITFTEGPDGVRAEDVVLNAGAGATGLKTKGGIGGTIKNVSLQNANISLLDVNSTADAGSGGSSKIGPGAKGGSIINLNVADIETPVEGIDINQPITIPAVVIRAGNGGDGGNGTASGGAGGAGGAISKTTIIGTQLNLFVNVDDQDPNTVIGGVGGKATLKGAGGAGGTISDFTFQSERQETGGIEVTADVKAGNGGAAAGNGIGGAGGDIRKTNVTLGQAQALLLGGIENLRIDGGAANVTAGTGGSNANAAAGGAGKGGSVFASAVASYASGVIVTAGNAGNGFKAAAGGKIDGVALDVNTTLTLVAGNGSSGGAGGDIRNIGFSRAAEDLPLVDMDLNPVATAGSAPLGSVNITAGAGSGAGKAAGNGGTVFSVTGYIGLSGATNVTAGIGGAGTSKVAAGGSVTDVNFFGGGGAGVELRVNAGDAAPGAPAVKAGGAGGSVKGVGIGVVEFNNIDPADPFNVFAVVPGTIIRHIAAGDGGDTSLATGKGGAGGSVTGVNVHHDIGLRQGAGFGYTSAGGIFAGEGGINTTIPHTPDTIPDAKKDGKAGSVIQITADAISAIVAGKLDVGGVVTMRNFATVVDGIVLNGSRNETLVYSDGTYVDFSASNVLGSVVNPDEVGVEYDPDNNPNTPAVMEPHANTFDTGEYGDTGANNVGAFGVGDTITADTDGFVAAISFINKLRNVRPEALLTVNAAGAPIFIDLNNTNGQEVYIP